MKNDRGASVVLLALSASAWTFPILFNETSVFRLILDIVFLHHYCAKLDRSDLILCDSKKMVPEMFRPLWDRQEAMNCRRNAVTVWASGFGSIRAKP